MKNRYASGQAPVTSGLRQAWNPFTGIILKVLSLKFKHILDEEPNLLLFVLASEVILLPQTFQ